MQLSKNFSIEELTVTETGAYNTPGEIELQKLLCLANYVLQPIREKWGSIRVNSAFRSKQVNDLIGGVTSSQHMLGEAADIVPEHATLEEVFQWIRENLTFGQVILEHKGDSRWIHVSLVRLAKENMQAMTFENGVYKNI